MRDLRIISILLSLTLITYGCAGMQGWQKGAMKGAGIGAVLGSGIGAVVGSTSDDDPDAGGGALIGAGIGALVGGIVGGITGKMKEEKEVVPPPEAKAEEAPPPPPPPPPPPAPKVEEVPPPPKRIVFQNILFDFDKSTIKPESVPILKEVVDYLKENHPEEKLSIEGYACWIGPEKYNQSLSEKRAISVKKYLISQGIDETRLVIKGFGEKMPVADNKTREGRKLNRRVELKIIEE